MLGFWDAPAAGKTIPKGVARSAPPFGRGFPAAGAAQTPKKSAISGRPRKPELKTLA
jgi:hypothetical protein